jgi:hypothetical protein
MLKTVKNLLELVELWVKMLFSGFWSSTSSNKKRRFFKKVQHKNRLVKY